MSYLAEGTTGWQESGWWRVIYDGGETGIWCETSDEDEARDHLKRVPNGTGKLQCQFVRVDREWRDTTE